MSTVGVTGSAGFLGWHLRCRLAAAGIDFIEVGRTGMGDTRTLDEFVRRADTIVHLAGVNRSPDEQAVVTGNVEPARALVAARQRTGRFVDVVYANSVRAGESSAYGEGKATAASILSSDCRASGSRFVDLRFPHLFGEFGRPFYNSAVATFAHQLARGERSTVNDGWLELLHVHDACGAIIGALSPDGEHRMPAGRKISVPDCYAVMRELASTYHDRASMPDLMGDELRLRLFNTIRAQLWPDAYPLPLVCHADERGTFFEMMRAHGQGQTSVSTTAPNVTRGNHFHFDKIERFVVVSGRARIRVRRLFTDDVQTFEVGGEEPVVIDMPTHCTHDIRNIGDAELLTLFWTHDLFDPSNPDTFAVPVDRERGGP